MIRMVSVLDRLCGDPVSEEVRLCAEAFTHLSGIDASDTPHLARLVKAIGPSTPGLLATRIFQAFEDAPDSDLGLIQIWKFVRKSAPKVYSAFKDLKAGMAFAADLYGDCYLVLGEFVKSWNANLKEVS